MDKNNWTYKKLGEICTILNGFAFKSNKYVEQGIRVLRITNVQNGAIVDNDPKFYPFNEEQNIKSYLLQENDLLISLTGNVGRVGLLQRELLPSALNQRVACLRIVSCNVLLRYLFNLLNSDHFENDCIFNAAGIAQKNMSTEWLKKYIVPIPPLAEQERIVAELDLLSSIIEKKKAQLKELDQLAQSIFYDMFGDPITNEKGWEVKKLGEIAIVKTGPFGSMLHKEDYIENGIPLVNPIHMKDYAVVPDMNFTISESKATELSNYLLQENDVVFARRGDIGRCAVINDKQKGFLCGTGSLFVRFTEPIDSIFIMHIIRSHSFTTSLISVAKGATMLNINSSIVENLDIPLPPLPLQQEFADKVEAIERQKSLIQQSIDETQTLFDSRMDYWFG